jgi:predicted DNA-binding antitoxin AbrB/MazE fold protein
MPNVLKGEAVYKEGKLELKEPVNLDNGEEVEVIILRKKGGIQTSTLYMETSQGEKRNIVQGICMVESIPSRIESFELKDALASLMGPTGPMLDPGLNKLEFYRMLLDKLSKKE